MTETKRLVSVGIPTYNRLTGLRTAVESVLTQDYENVEIVISDNASNDGTLEYCQALEAAHPEQVRYVRNDCNLGMITNLNRVRAACRGDYVMWLGDDDRLGPGFLSACVGVLDARPAVAHVAATVRYFEADQEVGRGEVIECSQAEGPARVLAYYRQVGDNGTFYGLTRRSVADRIDPIAPLMGGDWYLMAQVAFLGQVVQRSDIDILRSRGGATRSLRHVARSAGFSWIEGEIPQAAVTWLAFRDTAWASPVFRDLRRSERCWLGFRSASIVVRRFVVPSVPRYLRTLGGRVGRNRRP